MIEGGWPMTRVIPQPVPGEFCWVARVFTSDTISGIMYLTGN
jgi:hypothetical protein